MNGIATLALTYVGLVALALARDRHQNQAFGRSLAPAQSRGIRVLGWTLVAAATAPALIAWGVSVGISFWLGATSVAAVGCGLVFSYVPRQAVASGVVLAVVGAVCLVF